MPDFFAKRFEDRILYRENDGDAFERFVDEFLRIQAPETAFVPGLAKGPDGAIDLTDKNERTTQIVECKFIGSKTDGTAAKRWAEVKSNLDKNLPPLAAGAGEKRGRYRPWLKSHGDLKTYTFVTSAIAASVDERNILHKSIRAFFVELSAKHDELGHLRDIEVDLRYWDDLVGHSAHFAPLFFRWFGGLPPGYGEITLSFGSETGFKRFLQNNRLPYFGRDAFLAETGGNGDATSKPR